MADLSKENEYKLSLNQCSAYQGLIANYGFRANMKDVRVNIPQDGLILNGQRVIEFYPDNRNFMYLFDYPINGENPNGAMLLKLSQVQDKDLNYIFFNDIHFTRLFVMYYYMKTFKKDLQNMNGITLSNLEQALFQHYIYYQILPKLIIKSTNENNEIIFVYQQGKFNYIGKTGDLVMQLYSSFEEKAKTWYENIAKQAKESKYTTQYIGYTVPQTNVIQLLLQRKTLAEISQDTYLKQCIANGQITNIINICNLQIVNIVDSYIENLSVNQNTEVTIKQTVEENVNKQETIEKKEVNENFDNRIRIL